MKLSLDALKERAEGVASEELLQSISGGLEEACHDVQTSEPVPTTVKDNIPTWPERRKDW